MCITIIILNWSPENACGHPDNTDTMLSPFIFFIFVIIFAVVVRNLPHLNAALFWRVGGGGFPLPYPTTLPTA